MTSSSLAGHVIGLSHEHQRPDAASFVEFRCQNLPGYGRALKKVAKVKDGTFPPGTSPVDRMSQVSVLSAAKSYAPLT